ncbi:hypothetical protein LTR62_007741 [Meristemomyces frigidus]|uniref:Uncharacterized protein n=1 Tax=Meristemomyces frigidus TaxID=1508187 RepID=A0AAN7TA87_9PEZI|nr:hypothetical protein LTR62_007741 [Meristemomyces frigidus]
MFCTTLRRRVSFSTAIPALTASEGLKLRESRLSTHDIAIPLATDDGPHPLSAKSLRQLRILLLSPSSVADDKLESTVDRISHFASLTGGQDLAIVLLSSPSSTTASAPRKEQSNAKPDTPTETGTYAYAKLQATLLDHSGSVPYIPIILVAHLFNLPEVLRKHVSALTRPPLPLQDQPTSPFKLLHHCTMAPPMTQRTAYYISDLFVNLRELAWACSSVSSVPNSSSPSARAAGARDGLLSSQDTLMLDTRALMPELAAASKLKQLRDLVGEEQCRAVVEFWREEYVLQ